MTNSKTKTLSLNSLSKVITRSAKRIGRGFGSGKGGHTSSRGQKGQRSRRTIPWYFEGGQLPLIHRLPFLRGKGRLNPLKPAPTIVKTSQLEKLPAGSVVDLELLIKNKIVTEKSARRNGVKILFDQKFTKKLTVKDIPTSSAAAKLFEKLVKAK